MMDSTRHFRSCFVKEKMLVVIVFLLFGFNAFSNTLNLVKNATLACQNGERNKLEDNLKFLKTKKITIDEYNVKLFRALCDCLYDSNGFSADLNILLTDLLHFEENKTVLDYRQLGVIYHRIGKVHLKEREYAESKKYLYKAYEIIKDNKYVSAIQTADLYRDIGILKKRLGDVQSAIIFFEKSIHIYIIEEGLMSNGLGKLYVQYSECFTLSAQYSKAIETLNKAKKIFEKNKDEESISKCYQQIAYVYIQQEKYDLAVRYLKKSLNIKNKIFGESTMESGFILDYIGNTLLLQRKYDSSIKYYKLYQSIIRKNKPNHQYGKYLFSKIGTCYTNLQDFNRAEAYIDSSLFLLHFDERRLHPFEGLASPVDMIMILYFKAKNFLKRYEVYGCEEDLQDAAKWYSWSARLVEYTSSGFVEEDSKQYLLDRFYYVFETTIDAYDRLYRSSGREQYADSILCYMEKSRAILLKEAMSRAAAIHRAGVSDSLLLAERKAYEGILALENERHQILANGRNATNTASLELAARIFDEKEKRRLLLQRIEQLHPRFFKNTYQQDLPNLQAVRRRVLRPNETALQYFIGDDNLFVIAIGPKSCKTFRQGIPDSLAIWIAQLREAVFQRASSPDKQPATGIYAHAAHALYQCLIAPLGDLTDRLLILPDGVLEYLPFGALLYAPVPAEEAFGAYPYLVRKHSLRYGQSLEALMSYRPQGARYRRVLAMAPSFDGEADTTGRNYLSSLRNNAPEVRHIGVWFPANLLTGAEASKNYFEQSAGRYSVLHLATHAEANDKDGEYSFLAFGADTSSRLYVKNLYALHLPAELVVLSACETGLGELRRGEGLVSLARGFSYAGAGSLVTTLWRVSDRESAELMKYFYEALARRLPKDEALRQAQLQFIKAHEADNRANPFFWAAYVTIGDASPLSIPLRRSRTLWALGALLAVSAWGGQRYIRRRKKTAI